METTLQGNKLDFGAVKDVTKTIRAINHGLRQQIVKFIDENKRTDVTNIYVKLRLEQSVASQHLAILRNANIVKAERSGRTIHYSINDSHIPQVAKFVERITSEAASEM